MAADETREATRRHVPRPSVGLCFTSAELVDGELRQIGEDRALIHRLLGGLANSREHRSRRRLPAVVRRSALDAVGLFDPRLSQCADWDLWLRLSLETDLAAIGEPLVQYTKSGDTMSSDPALLERDTFALLDKFFASSRSRPTGVLDVVRIPLSGWFVRARTSMPAACVTLYVAWRGGC